MSTADARARMQASVYRVHGFAAVWPGVSDPVTVLRAVPEVLADFGRARAIVPTVLIKVRVSEVAAPALGDLVAIGTDTYAVIAEPRREDVHATEWTCEAELQA